MQSQYMRVFDKLFEMKDHNEYQLLHNYLDFYNEVLDGKPITSYPELNKYRKNMKILLTDLNLYHYIFDRDFNHHYQEFVDQVVYLAKALGSIHINKILVEKVRNFSGNSEDKEILDVVESIYLPQQVDDFNRYINNFNWLYNKYLWSSDILYRIYNYGNKSLNGLFKHIMEISHSLKNDTILHKEELMISLIMAYLHYNKLDNYELIDNYLQNVDYFEDKMRLNNCLHYVKGEKEDGSYNYKHVKLLFKNMDLILTPTKGIIK